MLVDLRPYVNTSPYSVHESTSVLQAYRFFRLNALRQMCVVDSENRCIGVITRCGYPATSTPSTASTTTPRPRGTSHPRNPPRSDCSSSTPARTHNMAHGRVPIRCTRSRYDLLDDNIESAATAESNWAVTQDDLPAITPRSSTSFHSPRQRRIVPIRDGDEIVGYKFQGGSRRSMPMQEMRPVEEPPHTTALGEMV